VRIGKTEDHSYWYDHAADTGAARRIRAALGVTMADDPNGRPDYFSPAIQLNQDGNGILCTCETDGFCWACR